MKIISYLFTVALVYSCAAANENTYVGSTPAHADVRKFLGISLTDSIDFIKWHLVIRDDRYELNCRYGLSRAGTNGFSNEKVVAFTGRLDKTGYYYHLQQAGKTFFILEVNSSLLYLLDNEKNMLVGNGGYSYALNSDTPVNSDQFNQPFKPKPAEHFMAFQGRTPCQELSVLPGGESNPACEKLKWAIILYTDSITGNPLYYLEGGRGFREETMERGRWEIIQKNGRVIYKLDINRRTNPLYLLKADDNILFFTDAEGRLLVGNENLSYTLNRSNKEK